MNYIKLTNPEKELALVVPFIEAVAKRITAIETNTPYDDTEFKQLYGRDIATIDLRLIYNPGGSDDIYYNGSAVGHGFEFPELLKVLNKHTREINGDRASFYSVEILKPYLSNSLTFNVTFAYNTSATFNLNIGMYNQ